jgi:hypothetical protein
MKKFVIIICSIVLFQNANSQAQAAGGGGGGHSGLWWSCLHGCLPFPTECKLGNVANSDIDFVDGRFVLTLNLDTETNEVKALFHNPSINLDFGSNSPFLFQLSEEIATKAGVTSLVIHSGQYFLGISGDNSKGYFYIPLQ